MFSAALVLSDLHMVNSWWFRRGSSVEKVELKVKQGYDWGQNSDLIPIPAFFEIYQI